MLMVNSSSTQRPRGRQGKLVIHSESYSSVKRISLAQSTLGRALATILNVPYISLDTLFWKPNWGETPTDEFREKVAAAIQNPAGWVVDGEYIRKLGDMVQLEATDVICTFIPSISSFFFSYTYHRSLSAENRVMREGLDPPLLLYFPRLVRRTVLRMLGLCPPCSPGCDESILSVFFSRTSVLWWSLRHHWSNQRRGRARMQVLGEAGLHPDGHGKMRRIGGWGGELKQWLKDVEEMARGREDVVH